MKTQSWLKWVDLDEVPAINSHVTNQASVYPSHRHQFHPLEVALQQEICFILSE